MSMTVPVLVVGAARAAGAVWFEPLAPEVGSRTVVGEVARATVVLLLPDLPADMVA